MHQGMHDSNPSHTTIHSKPNQTRAERLPLISEDADCGFMLKSPTCSLSPATCCIHRATIQKTIDIAWLLAVVFLFFSCYFFYLLMQAVLKRRRNTEYMFWDHWVFVWSRSAVIVQQDAREGRIACRQNTEYAEKRLSVASCYACESLCGYSCAFGLDEMFYGGRNLLFFYFVRMFWSFRQRFIYLFIIYTHTHTENPLLESVIG